MTIINKLVTLGKNIKPFSIIVEGNIACGKTTFLDHFKKFEDVQVTTEPVEMWRNCQGHNLLDIMYQDQKKWVFPFQMYAALTMLERHNTKTNRPVHLMERSIYSTRYCFVEKLTKDGVLLAPHTAILDEYYRWISQNVNVSVDLIVYLRSTPEVAYNRMMLRDRSEERNVSLKYIQELHKYHEDWLYNKTKFSVPAPVITLNADLDLSVIDDEYKKIEYHLEKVTA